MEKGFGMKGRRLLLDGMSALLVVLLTATAGSGMDRADLDKVLKTIPPNGPFWRYGNVTMRGRSMKAGMAPVIFSHWGHRINFTCRVCHLDLGFSMRRGDTRITREENLAGRFCGACHDGATAFSLQGGPEPKCNLCHMENGKILQEEFASFSQGLPMAPFGNGIDWAAALKDRIIRPANSLYGEKNSMKLPDKLKKPLKLGTASPRSDVSFSHEDHFAELDCSSCHPDIFNIRQKGSADFTMDSNVYGNYCGACHLQVAFPMNDCSRCHKSMNARY